MSADVADQRSDPSSELQERILAVFARIRETPDEPYAVDDLTHHLISHRSDTSSIRSTFKGCRYHMRFMRALETEFCVCFSYPDQERLRSLSQFVERIAFRQGKPASSLAVIRSRLKERGSCLPLVVVMLFIPVVAISLKVFGLGGLGVTAVPLLLIAWMIRDEHRRRWHYLSIQSRITKRAE